MLNDVFTEISQKMKVDFQGITSRIPHNGERGTARENMLEEYLRSYIPEKYAFAKGIIINAMDEASKQVDIIIHDKNITPYIFELGSTMVPIETVYATIEVKSRLTKEELEKAIKNIESVRRLQKRTINGISYPTAGYIFAYDSDASLETIYKNFIRLSRDIPTDHLINCICVFGKGLILPVRKDNLLTISLFPNEDTVYAIFNDPDNTLLLFYLLLFHTINDIQVFPPNMIEYAQSTGKLKTSLIIPSEYMPEDAVYSFMNHSITMKDIYSMQAYSKKFYSGELKQEEFLECEFGLIIPSLESLHGSLDRIPLDMPLVFLDVKLDCKVFLEMFRIYQKGEKASTIERAYLHDYEDYLYKIYDRNREIIKSSTGSE